VRDAAKLASKGRPSAPPNMNEVLTIPEARPDSSGATSLIATSSTGFNAMPAPTPSRIKRGRQNSTKQHPEAPAAGGDEAVHAHRLRSLGRLREQVDHQRERDGLHDRAVDPLHRTGADQQALRAC
jgi:hypothetical protein